MQVDSPVPGKRGRSAGQCSSGCLPSLRYPRLRARTRIARMNGKGLDWKVWGGALLAGGAVVAAALAMPVRLPDAGAASDPVAEIPAGALEAAPEDLSAFLEIRRWGAPPEEAKEPEPPPEEAGLALNPVLAKMGFVGLIAAQDALSVLLTLPEGEIVRMLPGDTLPDGRILVSVSDNSLTLQGEGQPPEVLTLFPRLPVESGPAAPVEDAQSDAGIVLSEPAAGGSASQ